VLPAAVLPRMGKPPRTPRKKPPAPSVGKRRPTAGPDITALIADEICTALERLDADEDLLSIVGSWRDTLDDAEILALLGDYNAGRPTLHRAQ
jgi:hypothetical protein